MRNDAGGPPPFISAHEVFVRPAREIHMLLAEMEDRMQF